MNIQGFRIHLRQLDDHRCPRCGEQLDRRPRRLWQKAVSFALPLRHYRCSGCNRRFFAFSQRWNRMNILEKFVRSLATVAILLIVLFASLIILWEIMLRVIA